MYTGRRGRNDVTPKYVNALWLNPIFESGWFDGGYDVIDFYKVDPRFGTNTDLVILLQIGKLSFTNRNIPFIVSFPPLIFVT